MCIRVLLLYLIASEVSVSFSLIPREIFKVFDTTEVCSHGTPDRE